MLAVLGLLLFAGPAPAADTDRHAGYYYPPVTSREPYKARAAVMPEASSDTRLGFVTALAYQQNGRAYPPTFVMFAKGENFERLIIVAIGSHGFRGIYQARAMLAQLTSIARGTPMFRDNNLQDVLTFLDLARMMGFEELTMSDGQTFAHRITLK
jgi:hypothetical protein